MKKKKPHPRRHHHLPQLIILTSSNHLSSLVLSKPFIPCRVSAVRLVGNPVIDEINTSKFRSIFSLPSLSHEPIQNGINIPIQQQKGNRTGPYTNNIKIKPKILKKNSKIKIIIWYDIVTQLAIANKLEFLQLLEVCPWLNPNFLLISISHLHRNIVHH